MRRIACCLLAASSWLAVPAWGGVRPRYGGTLRVALAESLSSLDPQAADGSADGALARARVTPLLFDTLVRVDAEDRAHPQLAVAWQADRSFQRWQFWLRPGVRFSDGTPMTAALVVVGLAGMHPGWTARVDGDLAVIESEAPQPGLLAELALGRNAVVRRGVSGELVGTGPFVVKTFQPGKSLELVANDASWGGRPFVDSLQIEFGKGQREQMVALQLGKVDWIEIAADQIGRVESEGRKAQVSSSLELVALVATQGGKARDSGVREVLSLAIDRKSIQSVLLRGGSEAAGGILPEWISGVGFLFPVQVDLVRARALVKGYPALTLSYEGGALGQLLAERVALNAREAGLSVQVVASGAADLRLRRIMLGSPDPRIALRVVSDAVGAQALNAVNSPQEIYEAEKKVMEDGGVIPLLHLPLASLASERVRNVPSERLGSWSLEEAWLETGQP